MTPREIILGNLNRTGPTRIGMNFGGESRMNDLWCVGPTEPANAPTRDWQRDGAVETSVDVWGNVWHRFAGMSQGGEVLTPVIEDWSQLDSLQLPDLAHPANFANVRQSFADAGGACRVGWLGGFPFAIARYMRKMEIYFLDLVAERENVDRLHEKITAILEAMIIQFADCGADAIMFCEDWGIQDRLLIHPNMWREIFKPIYTRLCHAARSRGVHVLMHSCGYNWEILDDLAEAGVSAFQFDQPHLYGLERLAEKLNQLGVCLFSPVDIQHVLPTGDRRLIVEHAEKMIDLFARPNGGLIAKNYPDLHGIGVKDEWDRWAYETFVANMTL